MTRYEQRNVTNNSIVIRWVEEEASPKGTRRWPYSKNRSGSPACSKTSSNLAAKVRQASHAQGPDEEFLRLHQKHLRRGPDLVKEEPEMFEIAGRRDGRRPVRS